MKKLLIGFAALPFLAGAALGGQPAPLSDVQMDQVTAGVVLNASNIFSGLTVPLSPTTSGCLCNFITGSNGYSAGPFLSIFFNGQDVTFP